MKSSELVCAPLVYALTEKNLVSANASSKPPRRGARWSERRSVIVLCEDLSLTGDSLEGGRSRCDPKRGQREVADAVSVPHSEDMVFKAGYDFFENTEESHERLDMVKVEWNDSMCGHLAGVRSLSFSPSGLHL